MATAPEPPDPKTRDAAALAGADGADRKVKDNAQKIASRAGRVQHRATEGAGRYYVIERFIGLGWCLIDSREPQARVVIGSTLPEAMRRFREVADRGVPAIVRGAS